MTGKYTELAREWLDDIGYDDLISVETLATLLRRVAREQTEEDAGIADNVYDEALKYGNTGSLHRDEMWEVSGEKNASKEIADALRSRAKELED